MPITVDSIDEALADASEAKAKGADLVEFRIDGFFHGGEAEVSGGDAADAYTVAQLERLLAESPLPVILTCRSADEGGDYDGDDADRVALYERLCTGESPPAYIDIELAAYTRSANLRQKVNLCVQHPKQQREVSTRLILSIHDFDQRPADLDRRLLQAYDEPACAIVKVAYRARSIRDNIDLFEILQESPKPAIALGMGEFGLMSRVLAPKFGGFLTFASLRDTAATAPGQPTIDELLSLYRFRKINKETRLYGVIGWPVAQSMSPLIHNAGFEAVGHNGVYLPLPIAADADDVEASRVSLQSTVEAIANYEALCFRGASVTIPFKQAITTLKGIPPRPDSSLDADVSVSLIGAANTIKIQADSPSGLYNTDANAIHELLNDASGRPAGLKWGIVGAGGAALAAVYAAKSRDAEVTVFARSPDRAAETMKTSAGSEYLEPSAIRALDELPSADCHAFINCTPLGMAHGPDPEALSIPIPEMTNLAPDTLFFDTVYNPIETPMLKAAKERGYRTIDGVQMFVRQAAAQFELWIGKPAPVELFDRLCRERLSEQST